MPDAVEASTSSGRRGARIAAIVTGIAVAATVAHAAVLKLPVLDDSAISIAYGQSLYAGAGLRLTPASAPVEGFSSPLWVVLVGLSLPFSAEPLGFARWLGIGLGALALVFVGLAAPAGSGRTLEPLDGLGPLLVACAPNYAYWICSGMETGLEALLLAASVWALARGFRLSSGVVAGGVLTLLGLTRPEAPLFIAAGALVWAIWLRAARKPVGRPELVICGILAVVCGGYFLFRWVHFARLLPNTYHAKRFWNFHAPSYLLGFVRAHALPLVVCTGLGVIGLTVRDTRRVATVALAFLGCGVLFVGFAGGDWMREWRFLAPLWPLFGVLAGTGVHALELARRRATLDGPLPASSAVRGPRGLRRLAPAAAALLALGTMLVLLPSRFRSAKASPGFAAVFVRDNAHRLRLRLDALGIERASLGVPDIGGLALALRKDRVVDVAGLADYAVAEHADNLPATEDYLLGEGLPEVLDFHGPSERLWELSRLLEHYSWSPGGLWELTGLGPGRDPRCPGGEVAPILAAPPRALLEAVRTLIERQEPEEAIRLVRCIEAHRPEPIEALGDTASLSADALRAAARADGGGHPERALRFFSLGTILAGDDAHLRRRTEQLRGRLFPPESWRDPDTDEP